MQLIDWMAQAIGKKSKNASDGGVDINDFQVWITSLYHPSLDEVSLYDAI